MEERQLEFDFIEKKEEKKPRKITVTLEIQDKNKVGWIWDSHLKENQELGIRVSSISEGDLNHKINKLEKIINFLEDKNAISYSHQDEFDSLMEEYESI
jgi:hypothetical protein